VNIRVVLRTVFVAVLFMVAEINTPSHAQGTAGAEAKLEPRYLIDVPTAGIIPHGAVALDLDFYQNGGLLGGVSLGAWDRLVIGISYGGGGLIGTDAPAWNKSLGFAIKLRILNETEFVPAIAIGFDSQGKELFVDRLNRYTIKSMGFYAVASKNYEAWGDLSFHGGINYSLERDDGDDAPNVFLGVDKSLGPVADIIAEYNLASNDSKHDALGRGRGYLDLGIRASVGGGLTIGFNLKDILKNQQDVSVGTRTVKIEYVTNL